MPPIRPARPADRRQRQLVAHAAVVARAARGQQGRSRLHGPRRVAGREDPRCPAVPASAPPAEQKSAAAASAIAPAAIAARRLPRRVLLIASDRKSTRLNSSHSSISYAVFCLKKKKIP